MPLKPCSDAWISAVLPSVSLAWRSTSSSRNRWTAGAFPSRAAATKAAGSGERPIAASFSSAAG
jgi:hypothetical protein